MNKNLQLAVNHALADATLARARMLAANPIMGLDAKRSTAWCEYGFKEDLTFDDLYSLYRRGGIAHGAVRKIISNCWLSNPEIIEGEKADEARKVTAWESRAKAIFTCGGWWDVIPASCCIFATIKTGICL